MEGTAQGTQHRRAEPQHLCPLQLKATERSVYDGSSMLTWCGASPPPSATLPQWSQELRCLRSSGHFTPSPSAHRRA